MCISRPPERECCLWNTGLVSADHPTPSAKSDESVRHRLHSLLGGRLASWTSAHEEAQADGAFVSEADMTAPVTLLVSADLGLGVLAAPDIDLPEPSV
jgi:hypothetical protein